MVEGVPISDKRLGRRAFPALACIGLLACPLVTQRAASTASEANTRAKTHIVTIEGLRFNPPSLTVDRGDRIVWVNKDLFPHTVTAEGKDFDSHDIAPMRRGRIGRQRRVISPMAAPIIRP